MMNGIDTILAVKFKNHMFDKAGYYKLAELEYLDVIKFDTCLKVPAKGEYPNNLVLYWEDFEFAMVCTVLIKSLPSGCIQATLLTKDLVKVDDIGDFTGKKHYGILYYKDNRVFNNEKEFNRYMFCERETDDVEIPKIQVVKNTVNTNEKYNKKKDKKQKPTNKKRKIKQPKTNVSVLDSKQIDDAVERLREKWNLK